MKVEKRVWMWHNKFYFVFIYFNSLRLIVLLENGQKASYYTTPL